MRVKITLLVLTTAMVFVTSAWAQSHGQHAPSPSESNYAAIAARSVKALSDEQIADLRAAKGMGLALAAELNGYPGPLHVLQLADQLELTPSQRVEMQSQVDNMKRDAGALGEDVIALETELDRQFASRSITPASLDEVTSRIGQKQAALRSAHLKYHLSTINTLNAEQVKHDNGLRGYDGHHTSRDKQKHE